MKLKFCSTRFDHEKENAMYFNPYSIFCIKLKSNNQTGLLGFNVRKENQRQETRGPVGLSYNKVSIPKTKLYTY